MLRSEKLGRISREEERVFRELYEIIDYGKQGLANPREIIGVLKAFGTTFFHVFGPPSKLNKTIHIKTGWEQDIPKIFSAIVELLNKEELKNGVTYPQFLSIFTTGLIANQTKDQIKAMFNYLDEDESGTIKLDDLKRLAKDIGESVTMEELREMVKNITGSNGDPEITFEEFYNIFKRTTAPPLR